MLFKIVPRLVLGGLTLAALFFSLNVAACDSKACENASKKITQHYADIRIRHAIMQRAERLAHAKNRENEDIAYWEKTHRYVENETRHAKMTRAERLAYAKNRERRALALYMHIHQTHSTQPRAITVVGKAIIKEKENSTPLQLIGTSNINHVALDK